MPLKTNKDKGQGFAGGGDPQANQHPSHFGHGGGGDSEESVELNPLDRSGPPMPGREKDTISGHDPERTLARGDAPHTIPRDAKRDTTPTEIISSNDHLCVGSPGGYFSGDKAEKGSGEQDWTTPLGGNSEGPSRTKAVGISPGIRDAPQLRRRNWEDFIPGPGRNDRTPESKTPSRQIREDK